MKGLFESQAPRPLADLLRPERLGQVLGQDHLLAEDGPIGRMLAQRRVASMILWGPPGVGKTTIARLLAQQTDYAFEPLSAVFSGVAELRKVFHRATEVRQTGRGTLLFIDEVHRFNRAQQDGFLPYVENGTVVLVGATTENPSFELNAALLSRCQVFVLRRLDDTALETLLMRSESAIGRPLPLDRSGRDALKAMADGDGRFLLNLADELLHLPNDTQLDGVTLARTVQKRAPVYDKNREEHYNLISALHKSLRGSDEDIGLADPQALPQALACWSAYDRMGSPEGELAVAQCTIYLATAPKSNAIHKGFAAAKRAVQTTGSLMPPAHILSAPTPLMKDLGHGADYAYDHDSMDSFSGQNYFPEAMERQRFYHPIERGFEREIIKRLAWWEKLRRKEESSP